MTIHLLEEHVCRVCGVPAGPTKLCIVHFVELENRPLSHPPIRATGTAAPSVRCGHCSRWVEPEGIRPDGLGCWDCQADTLVVAYPHMGGPR